MGKMQKRGIIAYDKDDKSKSMTFLHAFAANLVCINMLKISAHIIGQKVPIN
jgi:hypothetical protein